MVQNSHKWRHKYWATGSSVCSFPCTAYSYACSALLALLMRSTALICLLAPHTLPSSWENEWLNVSIWRYSEPKWCRGKGLQRRWRKLRTPGEELRQDKWYEVQRSLNWLCKKGWDWDSAGFSFIIHEKWGLLKWIYTNHAYGEAKCSVGGKERRGGWRREK